MPTEISQMPQSSVVAINNEQSKYPNVSAHNLEIQVAGTAGIFAGGVVAIGTITGFNKFYKFLKIVKNKNQSSGFYFFKNTCIYNKIEYE